jgi:hypothetical protein
MAQTISNVRLLGMSGRPSLFMDDLEMRATCVSDP